jgi:hypothetical protein
MKISFYHILLLVIIVAGSACKKDNYDAPDVKLSGRLVYNNQSIEVEYNQVPFELYQFGFGKTGPIGNSFAPDGTYSVLLFKGSYKFIIPNGQGPFKWKQTSQGAPDSLTIDLNGSQELNIEVTPYYMIRNPQLTATGGKVNASFAIEKIITDASAKNIEQVRLYINKTQFVSGADNMASASIDGGAITNPAAVNLGVTVPSQSQNYVYARIGLKIAGVEDMIFSPVTKVQL